MKKLLLIALLIVGCDNSTDPAGNNSTTYATSDLEGTWIGDITVTDAPNAGVYNISISFDGLGNCVEVVGATESTSGNITVSNIGEMTGTIIYIYNTNLGIETNTVDLSDSYFITKTQISMVSSNCLWSNTNGNSGTYSLSGILSKSSVLSN